MPWFRRAPRASKSFAALLFQVVQEREANLRKLLQSKGVIRRALNHLQAPNRSNLLRVSKDWMVAGTDGLWIAVYTPAGGLNPGEIRDMRGYTTEHGVQAIPLRLSSDELGDIDNHVRGLLANAPKPVI